ncbi:unnamed protein product [Tetraodon nigroviridis]|uniref:GMP reductase n=1 Tax=Tetraodon nigroviridis TaxID=99883 RepID=Q4T162_TETNG|nr:unnamed protein product [Tetraodon nigroviridis]
MPRVDADLKLDFKDVLFRPKRSSLRSRSEVGVAPVDLQRTFTFRNSKQTYTGIPVIAANMDTTGTFEMARVLSKHTLFTAIHKHYSVEDWKKFAVTHPECLEHVAASSGSSAADLEKLCSVLEAVPALQYICLDVANGYSEHFVEFVKMVREKFPKHTIMAGNVVTGEMVEELILSGADIIKVGIGPGSVCTTRIKTGVGYPQLSAVIECADSAHGLKGHIISVRWRLQLPRRRRKGLWRRSGFRDDGRNAGRSRPVLRRGHREERQEIQALLRHELRHGHEEVCRRGCGVQGVRGEDGGGSLQRRRGGHPSGRPRGAALHLHLRGCSQAQRAQQENHFHPRHTTSQPNVHLAGNTHTHTHTCT